MNYVIVLSLVILNIWRTLSCIWLPSIVFGHVKASYNFWSRFSWHGV